LIDAVHRTGFGEGKRLVRIFAVKAGMNAPSGFRTSQPEVISTRSVFGVQESQAAWA
jgi:hypothetical protein